MLLKKLDNGFFPYFGSNCELSTFELLVTNNYASRKYIFNKLNHNLLLI